MHILKNKFFIAVHVIVGVAQDELFGQFCGALEKIQFFKPTASGDDDHAQLDKAKLLFDEALLVRMACFFFPPSYFFLYNTGFLPRTSQLQGVHVV